MFYDKVFKSLYFYKFLMEKEEDRYKILVVFFLINTVFCDLIIMDYYYIRCICFFILQIDQDIVKVLYRRVLVFLKFFDFKSVYIDFSRVNFIDFINEVIKRELRYVKILFYYELSGKRRILGEVFDGRKEDFLNVLIASFIFSNGNREYKEVGCFLKRR